MRKFLPPVMVAILLVTGASSVEAKSGKGAGYDQLNLFTEAYNRIREDAVEPVGEAKLIGAAIAGMLSGLDVRSSYVSEAALRTMRTQANEGQAGLGLVVTIENGQLKVISPQDGSPAARAGIRPGDLIAAIDGLPAYELTLEEAEQKLLGPAGGEVELSWRRGNERPLSVKLTRGPYKLRTVASRVESGNIGYLRVAGFDVATPAELASAIHDLQQRPDGKLIGFILDLRNNPGGSFDAAVAVADTFIDKGDIVVVKGRTSASVRRISATPGDAARGLPVVALINGGTAREAELVAGCLQDNRRAVLLGTRSYGESSIESLIPLPGNGAIRLTTARFMTPTGRRIQGKGLDPDLTVMPLKLAKLAQGYGRREADLRGALKNIDPIAPRDPEDSARPAVGASALTKASKASSVTTGEIGSADDEQLSEAVDVLRGLALVTGRPG